MAIVPFELSAGPASCRFLMDDAGGLDHVVTLARAAGLARYEAPYTALMAVLTAHLDGDFLDVGANTGLYSLMSAALRRDITVHAFEPLRAISDVLLRNLALNPTLRSRIVLHRVALSAASGDAVFYETINPHGLFSTSSTLDRAFGEQHGETRKHTVPALTLDDWIDRHGIGAVSFVKMDVEGHETAVISGAVATLRNLRPVVGIELLDGADFSFLSKVLATQGYFDCIVQPSGLTITDRPRFVSDGWNHLFVPQERIALVRSCAELIGLPMHDAR